MFAMTIPADVTPVHPITHKPLDIEAPVYSASRVLLEIFMNDRRWGTKALDQARCYALCLRIASAKGGDRFVVEDADMVKLREIAAEPASAYGPILGGQVLPSVVNAINDAVAVDAVVEAQRAAQ